MQKLGQDYRRRASPVQSHIPLPFRDRGMNLFNTTCLTSAPRIWVPTPENRDVRQLVLHRHRLVGMRTRVMNQLQAIAMNEGVRRKRGLWTGKGRAQLEALRLPPWTTRRRQELLELLDRFDPSIDQ